MSGMVLGHLARHAYERDIDFGLGFDYSRRDYVLSPKSTARIIRWDAAGVNTVSTIAGQAHYTRTTFAGCKALVRADQGDWVLFPGGTTTWSPGDTVAYGELQFHSGYSMQYPFVLGTYDASDPTNIAKYNDPANPAIFDFTNIPYPVAFLFNLSRGEDFIAITNIWAIHNGSNASLTFYNCFGPHTGILLQGCMSDAGYILIQAGYASTYDIAITGITSSGTTATATHATSGFDAHLVAGATTVNIAGATPSSFNGTYTVTRTSSTTFTYTFAGNSNNPATGTIYVALDGASIPDSRLVTDVIFNRTNVGNVGPFALDSITLNQYTEQVRRVRYYDMVTHHGGWTRTSDRDNPRRVWATGALTTITSLGHVAGVATANTASTAGLVANDTWVYISGATPSTYVYCTQVRNIVANTSFQYYVDPSITITANAAAAKWAIADNGDWDGDIGGSPTDKNHNFYCSQYTNDVRAFRTVSSWDSANAKFTGGPYEWDGFFEIRPGIGMLTGSDGNAVHTKPWPSNCQYVLKNHTMINAADIEPSYPRGYAPQIQQAADGSGVFNGLLINEDNPDPTNREGYKGWANGSSIPSFFEMRHCFSANWDDHNGSVAVNTTKVYSYNIVDTTGSALPGTGNTKWTDQAAGVQAKRTALMAKNVHTTFRLATPQLAGVATGATDIDTENNVCNYMLRDPRTPWYMLLQAHVRQPIGR